MRLIDADALMRCVPAEEMASRMAVANAPTIEKRKTGEWLHDLLQDAIDDGIITEVQAVKIIERAKA